MSSSKSGHVLMIHPIASVPLHIEILFLLNFCTIFFFFTQEGLRKHGSQWIVEAIIDEHSISQ